jgi:hypothetical protein
MATVYLRDFPEKLHHAAKVRAAQEGIALKQLIINAVHLYLYGPPEARQAQTDYNPLNHKMTGDYDPLSSKE